MTLGRAWRHRPADADSPLRDEFIGADRLDDRAASLASRFIVDPRARARTHPAAARGQRARARQRLCDAGRRRARGPIHHLRVGVAARQLPSGDVPDSRTSVGTCRRRTIASCRRSPSREQHGTRPHLRHGHRTGPPQRQPSRSGPARVVPQWLSARRAADDRRALGVAEHADAGARRESPPAGRRDSRVARRRGRWPTITCFAPTPRRPSGLARPHPRRVDRATAAADPGIRTEGAAPADGRRSASRRDAHDAGGRRPRRSTGVRASRRSRSPTRSPAFASARRSTGASTSNA